MIAKKTSPHFPKTAHEALIRFMDETVQFIFKSQTQINYDAQILQRVGPPLSDTKQRLFPMAAK